MTVGWKTLSNERIKKERKMRVCGRVLWAVICVKHFFLQQKKRTLVKKGLDLRRNITNLLVMLLNWHNKVLLKRFIPPGEQATLAWETLLERCSSQRGSCEARDIQCTTLSLFSLCVLCVCVCVSSKPQICIQTACPNSQRVERGRQAGWREVGNVLSVGVSAEWEFCLCPSGAGFLMRDVQRMPQPELLWNMCSLSSFFLARSIRLVPFCFLFIYVCGKEQFQIQLSHWGRDHLLQCLYWHSVNCPGSSCLWF